MTEVILKHLMTHGGAFGVIFDWDGVIVDSSSHHEESWERLAREESRHLPPGHFKQGFGRTNDWIIPHLLGWTDDPAQVRRLSERKEALYRLIVEERGLAPVPGVVEWIDRLREAAVPRAIGSSTPRVNIERMLARVGLAGRFDVVVTADDVTQGKPHPQVFLMTAERLGLPPARCVVCEDMPVGIQAAKAAGMLVIAVTTSCSADALRQADRIVDRLDEVAVEDVSRLVTGA